MVLIWQDGGMITALQCEGLPAAAYITTWLKTLSRQVDKEYIGIYNNFLRRQGLREANSF